MGIPDIESAGKIKPVHQKADLDRPVTEVMEDAIVSLTDEDVCSQILQQIRCLILF